MDPPWVLSTGNPTRGVATNYHTLTDQDIYEACIPFEKLQTDGFLFIWVINNKYKFALDLFARHNYKLVEELVWVKQTVNGKINKGHGYYLQHAKETCLVGYKGDLKDRLKGQVDCDVIFSQRRGQSQKPEEIYELVEQLVPNGYYLEVFSRRNNLHNGWVSIGNEL
jgi:mRNA (2'-O-methyladenosine-N6-)-methyltransferase